MKHNLTFCAFPSRFGFAVSAGIGFDYRLNRALALRLADWNLVK